jgi:hypothetical protein
MMLRIGDALRCREVEDGVKSETLRDRTFLASRTLPHISDDWWLLARSPRLSFQERLWSGVIARGV